MKLMRLNEIHTFPVGSDKWKTSVHKYALMSLSDEQSDELKLTGHVSIQMTLGYCSDHKMYKCIVTLYTVGTDHQSNVTFEAI